MKIGYWARKAGVSIHPHSLRHKFATDILERGGNIRAVQQLLGHESLGTTETYLAVTNNTLREAVNLLAKSQGNKSESTTQTSSASNDVNANGSKSDHGIADLKAMLDPAHLCQPLQRNTVEDVRLAELPLIDKNTAARLVRISSE